MYFYAIVALFVVIFKVCDVAVPPFVEQSCYDDLCKIVTSYYDNVNNFAQIFIPSAILAHLNYTIETLCIDIEEYPGEVCGQDELNKFHVSMPYHPHIQARIYLKSDPSQYYIVHYYLKLVNSSLLHVDHYIEHTFPYHGSIVSGKLLLEYNQRMKVKRNCENNFNSIGLMGANFNMNSRHITSTSQRVIEPGSWFMIYTPCEEPKAKDNNSNKKKTSKSKTALQSLSTPPPLQSYAYIEYVFTRDEIRKERLFRNLYHPITPTLESDMITAESCIDGSTCSIAESPTSSAISSIPTKAPPRTHVCYWGSTNADGQRSIWLNQIKYMNSKEFRFSYILTRTGKKKGPDLEDILLSYKNVEVYPSPFNEGFAIAEDILAQDGLSPQMGKDFYEFMTKKLQEANYNVHKINPSWVFEVYGLMLNVIEPLVCDVLVYGNERDTANDVLITDAAKILGYPSVAELMNLFPSSVPNPSVVVGPSLYALQHESVTSMVEGISNESHRPELIVISPAVDLHKFNASREDIIPVKHSTCVDNHNDKCLTVGYVGRLAPEKNIGLFIMAAHIIHKQHPNIRFTIIGDGILKESLIDMTHRLAFNHMVDFVGWIDNAKLPSYLAGIDIVVNPSLRAWSETFCISNIEVMSMGVPLVTFGVGGVGEYVEVYDDFDEKSRVEDVVIGKNAVLVNKAAPDAVASAVMMLLSNATLLHDIGLKGQVTVATKFHLQRQMDEYSMLYKRLGKNKVHEYKERNKDYFQRAKSKKN